jgi:hypothetical protein
MKEGRKGEGEGGKKREKWDEMVKVSIKLCFISIFLITFFLSLVLKFEYSGKVEISSITIL